MSIAELFLDGLVVTVKLAAWSIALFIAGFLMYCALLYIGCSLSSVPMEHRDKNIYWRGGLRHENNDEDLNENGFLVIGAIVTWIGIIVSILIFVGYVANQLGVA